MTASFSLTVGVLLGAHGWDPESLRCAREVLFTLVISLATRDQLGRRRARTINSKYDLNPQLTIATNRSTSEAREEQRDREAWFGWEDEDDERPREEPTEEELGLPVDTVRVARFRDPAQAHLLRGRLESTGIAAVVHAQWVRPHLGTHDVYVADENADKALAVIAELRQSWGEGERAL
jgi:hypothetical protein